MAPIGDSGAEAPNPTKQSDCMTHPDRWEFNGAQYDFAAFADQHPGGSWVIRESKGFDITYLVQCNHRWTEKQAEDKLAKFRLVNSKGACGVRWDPKLTSIQQALRKSGFDIVRAKTPFWGWAYYLILGLMYLAFAYNWAVSPTWSNAFLFGALGWLWGGFLQHEGGHAALSRNPTVNLMGRYAILPWATPERWFVKHSILHHQFTNTKQDMDFQTAADQPVRHHLEVPWNPLQRLQLLSVTVYSPLVLFLYSGLSYVTAMQAFIISTHYMAHGAFFMATLPFFTFGMLFVFVTQLNHIQESCVSAGEVKEYPDDFVDHQVKSCVDYNHGNFLASALCIFLNYQTYHHLFPSVSHFHYLTRKPLLDRVLAEHHIAVNEQQWHKVVGDYYRYLLDLSYFHTV